MEENTENYTEISGEEFKAILRGEKLEYVTVDSSRFPPQTFININNLKVKQPIYIDTELLNFDLKFTSGFFEEINFTEVFYKDEYEDVAEIMSDELKKPKIRNYKKARAIEIEGGTFNSLNIYSGFFEYFFIKGGIFGLFHIEECLFEGKFNINNGTFQDILISGGKFQDIWVLEGSIEDFFLTNGVFRNIQFGDYYIEEIPLKTNRIILTGGTCDNISFDGLESKEYIRLSGTTVFNSCKLRYGKYKYIMVEELKSENISIWLSDKMFIDTIGFNLPKAKNISIYGGYVWNTLNVLQFIRVNINNGILIKIDDIYIHRIIFDNCVNAGNIIFSGVKSKKLEGISPTLKIHNSDLGKTTFIDCDFEGMELDFKSSKITEVFLAGTKMPKDITTDDNEQKRLGYGQLKKIYDNRGDTVTANEYFAREMNVLYDQTKWSDVPFWKNPIKWLWRFSREKINLFFNKISSNHGTSWGRALWVTVGFAGFFYWLYCLSLSIYPAFPTWDKWENFGEYMSYFIEFINPFHKADYIAESLGLNSKINGWTRFIDGGSRIINSYFIYQLIQAFRKHRRGS
ncbi:hypothetical protein AD998_11865 [bacterium 336/3]|nr:hypothetical protein AD998_11865 [bacterium 336/3]